MPTRPLRLLLLPALLRAQSCGICPSGNESGAVGNFPTSSLAVTSNPVGNSPLTWTALNVQGVTGQSDEREFLVSLGLLSNAGNNSRPTPCHDKVTLYVAVEAASGTGDVWAINPLVTQMPDSGEYNAQGIELDFNNLNSHRGDADGGGGLAPPVSYGLSISGAAPFRSTSAMLVSGSGRIWNRGVTFANDCIQQSTFQDLGNPDKSIDIRGSPTFGVYQVSKTTKNFFAGGTGFGVSSPEAIDGRAALHVGARGLIVDGTAQFEGGRQAVLAAEPGTKTLRAEGTVTLDAEGGARVVVPGLARMHAMGATKDVTYALTAVGAPMPNLHVSKEVVEMEMGMAFEVAGGAAGKRVSWALHVLLSD
jgi:hypothetical protein